MNKPIKTTKTSTAQAETKIPVITDVKNVSELLLKYLKGKYFAGTSIPQQQATICHYEKQLKTNKVIKLKKEMTVLNKEYLYYGNN